MNSFLRGFRKQNSLSSPVCKFGGVLLAVFVTPQLVLAQEACLNDVAQFNNAVCTANDVRVSKISVQGGLTSCVEGETITLTNLEAEVLSGAHQRYDIGIYIATDGGDAKASVGGVDKGCFRDILEPVGAAPTEFDNIDGDGCGDIRQRMTETKKLDPVVLTCADSDGDGFLDVGACLSWDNNKRGVCSDESDAIPGTPSKCRCESVQVGQITVERSASITFLKRVGKGDDHLVEFDFYFGAASATQEGPIPLSANGSPVVRAPLQPGDYKITEAQRSGWILRDIDCENDSGFEPVFQTSISGDNAGGEVTITLHEEEDVSCTFVNAQPR